MFVDMSMQLLANIGNLYQGLQGKLCIPALHAARDVKCGSFNTLTPVIYQYESNFFLKFVKRTTVPFVQMLHSSKSLKA